MVAAAAFQVISVFLELLFVTGEAVYPRVPRLRLVLGRPPVHCGFKMLQPRRLITRGCIGKAGSRIDTPSSVGRHPYIRDLRHQVFAIYHLFINARSVLSPIYLVFR